MEPMTTSEVARVLGLSASRVIKIANAGQVKVEVTALGRLYDATDVERLRAERAAKAAV